MKRLRWLALLPVLLLVASNNAHKDGGPFEGIIPTSNGVFTPSESFTYPDLDDAPGVADGSGADPNPYPGSWVGRVQRGGLLTADTYMLDSIDVLTQWNGPEVAHNLDLWSSSMAFEYSYGVTRRSGAGPQVEYYWQYTPATHRITFAAGGSGQITFGDNITFSDGAVCRPAQEDANLADGALIRMFCVGHVAPAAAATISSCTGTCTGPPSGTVSGAPFNDRFAWRPFFYQLHTDTNRVDWDERRGYVDSDPGHQALYWMSAQSGDTTLHLGTGGYTDANPARVSIPTNADTSGYGLVINQGDVDVDTTQTDAVGGTGRFEFSDRTPPASADEVWAISPVITQCYQVANVAAASDNVNLPASYIPLLIKALGCRDDTTAAPATAATMTLHTAAGAAISLDAGLTCSGKNSAMAFQKVTTSDTDRKIAQGITIQFDTTNTPNPATDTYSICWVATAQRQ